MPAQTLLPCTWAQHAASLSILQTFQAPFGASMMQPPDITGYLVFQQGTDMLLINTNETRASAGPGRAPACACKAAPKSWL